MKFRRMLKILKQSKVLTKKEKRKLIIKGTVESIVNSYKIIIKIPFQILGITFATLEFLFNSIAELFSLIEQVFSSICLKIDDIKEFTLTSNSKAREKVLKEIKENQIKKIDKKDLTK